MELFTGKSTRPILLSELIKSFTDNSPITTDVIADQYLEVHIPGNLKFTVTSLNERQTDNAARKRVIQLEGRVHELSENILKLFGEGVTPDIILLEAEVDPHTGEFDFILSKKEDMVRVKLEGLDPKQVMDTLAQHSSKIMYDLAYVFIRDHEVARLSRCSLSISLEKHSMTLRRSPVEEKGWTIVIVDYRT